MNEAGKQRISEIKNHFENIGYDCKTETRTLKETPGKALNNSLNKIDICCNKNKDIHCFEIEDTTSQCLLNQQGLKQAKQHWEKEGYKVNTCQMEVGADFKEACQNIPKPLNPLPKPTRTIVKRF